MFKSNKTALLKQTVKYLKQTFNNTTKFKLIQPTVASGSITVSCDSRPFQSGNIHVYLEKFLKSSIMVKCLISPDQFTTIPGDYSMIIELSPTFFKESKSNHILWLHDNTVDFKNPHNYDPTTLVCTKHFKNPRHPTWLNEQVVSYLQNICSSVRLVLSEPREYTSHLIVSANRAFSNASPNQPMTQIQGQALNDKLNLIIKKLDGQFRRY